jgi:hypothetical protein
MQVVLPIAKVALVCFVPLLLLRPHYAGARGIDALLVCALLDVWVAVCVFVLGLRKAERDFVLRKIGIR